MTVLVGSFRSMNSCLAIESSAMMAEQSVKIFLDLKVMQWFEMQRTQIGAKHNMTLMRFCVRKHEVQVNGVGQAKCRSWELQSLLYPCHRQSDWQTA